MLPRLAFVPDLPDPEAFEQLMRDYYDIIAAKLRDMGGPQLLPEDLVRDTMAHLEELLPPKGRILLATEDNGRLLACGVIRKIRPDAAEFKRMFVRPEAQGRGLGRRIFDMRIIEARRMGCRVIYADTLKENNAMLSIYEKFGFSYVPRYPENANPPDLAPFLVYLEKVLPRPD